MAGAIAARRCARISNGPATTMAISGKADRFRIFQPAWPAQPDSAAADAVARYTVKSWLAAPWPLGRRVRRWCQQGGTADVGEIPSEPDQDVGE